MIKPLDNLNREGVSMVICTYNGIHRIVPTLQHLARQVISGLACELIVVDNNSTDQTDEKALAIWKQCGSPFPLRIIHEPQAGTMYARLRGIRESAYRYLLYCDDDNWLHEHYLQTAYEIITADEKIAAVGGEGVLVFEPGFTPPDWIDKFKNNYGAGAQGKRDGDTTTIKGCLYTAGAILDRKWLSDLYAKGFVSSLSGRHAGKFLAGEDTELTFALKLIGGKLFFSSAMRFMHFMPKERIHWEYLKRMNRSFGYSDFIIAPYLEYFGIKKSRGFVSFYVRNLYEAAMLYLKIRYHGLGVGSQYVLLLERLKGERSAMISDSSKYRSNQEMVRHLIQLKIAT